MLPELAVKSRLPGITPYVVSSPLWSRAPARDENGKPYSDFMILIPGLKQLNEAGIESCLVKIRHSLRAYENIVVYVDLNIKLNCLWVSHKPIPGITNDLVRAILQQIPHAKVVAGDFNFEEKKENQPGSGWFSSINKRFKNNLKRLVKR